MAWNKPKILYFNGCSYAQGAEIGGGLGEGDDVCVSRTSYLLSKRFGYTEQNEARAGQTNHHIIEQTIEFAYRNKNNSDDIIINVWLTSPERKIFYYNSNPFMLSPWMILNNILPHQTDPHHWREMREDVTKFTELWVEFFHNQRFFISEYVKDVLLLYTTLKELGYKFLIANAFYDFGSKEHNLPFYEDSARKKHFATLRSQKLWNNVISKLPKENFLFGSVEYSIKDNLLSIWEEQQQDYLDYDTSKLSSILVADDHEWKNKEPNYFFCEQGHPSELGAMKISELIEKHYNKYNFTGSGFHFLDGTEREI